MNDKADEKTDRIGDDVALAPLDPFSGIIAANPATFSGFHALTVNHTRCRAGRTPDAQTRHLDQTLVDFAQQAVAAPVIEIASHCRDGREVMGQHPPLAPGRCDVEDRVKHIPQIHRRGRPMLRRAGSNAAISAHSPSLASLAYLPPPRSYCAGVSSVQAIVAAVQCCNRTESQTAEFTQLISDQTLSPMQYEERAMKA